MKFNRKDDEVQAAMDEAALRELPKINARTPYLAMLSNFAVMAGLRHRDQTGEGQRIDTSLLGTAMSLATPTSVWFPTDAEGLNELDEELAALRAAGAAGGG